MDVDQVVLLGRMVLQEVVILAGPCLAVAILVSLSVNIAQVLTSLQDMTVSTVARLIATGSALFVLMPGCGVIWHLHARHVFRFSRVLEMIDIPLIAIITGLLTIGVRITGLMLFAPFLGSAVIPPHQGDSRAGDYSVALSHGWPTMARTLWPNGCAGHFGVHYWNRNGLATNVVFEAVQLTGQVLGVQMGYSLVNILDPQSQVDTTVVACSTRAL